MLANDIPGVAGDNKLLTAVKDSDPTKGTLKLSDDGTFTYSLSNTTFTDTSPVIDSFTYHDKYIYKGLTLTSPKATVTITITPPGLPVVPPPVPTNQNTPTGPLKILVATGDDTYATGFKITGIPTDGKLTKSDGKTVVSEGQIINIEEGKSGLIFNPDKIATGDRTFKVQEVSKQGATTILGATTELKITIAATADLGLVFDKTTDPPLAVLNLPLTYTATITNSGPSEANGIVLEETFENITFDTASVTIVIDGQSHKVIPTITENHFKIDFAAPGLKLTLPPDETATLKITITPRAGDLEADIQNIATVSNAVGTPIDPNPTDNSGRIDTRLSDQIVVQSPLNDGDLTLRWAIESLEGLSPDQAVTIVFDPAFFKDDQTISLNRMIVITRPVVILGSIEGTSSTINIDGSNIPAYSDEKKTQPNAILKVDFGSATPKDGVIFQDLMFTTSSAYSAIELSSGKANKVLNTTIGGTTKHGIGILIDGSTESVIAHDTITGVENGILITTNGNTVGGTGERAKPDSRERQRRHPDQRRGDLKHGPRELHRHDRWIACPLQRQRGCRDQQWPQNTVGGTEPGTGNLISGNGIGVPSRAPVPKATRSLVTRSAPISTGRKPSGTPVPASKLTTRRITRLGSGTARRSRPGT